MYTSEHILDEIRGQSTVRNNFSSALLYDHPVCSAAQACSVVRPGFSCWSNFSNRCSDPEFSEKPALTPNFQYPVVLIFKIQAHY